MYIDELKKLPLVFDITDISPNPIIDNALIKLSLPARIDISFRIYDTAGRLVTTLINGEQNEGHHVISLDVSSLTTGIYFALLRSDSNIDTKKIIILR